MMLVVMLVLVVLACRQAHYKCKYRRLYLEAAEAYRLMAIRCDELVQNNTKLMKEKRNHEG